MAISGVGRVCIGIAAASVVTAVFARDGLVIVAAGFSLAILISAVWSDDSIPVFLAPLLYQWLQIATKPIEALLTGVPLDWLSSQAAPLTPAVFLSFGCLSAIALGIRVGLGRLTAARRFQLLSEVRGWSNSQAVTISLGLVAAGYAAGLAAALIGPLRQPLIAVASIRLVGLFMLAFWSVSSRRGTPILVSVVGGEIVMGLTGFFADFRGTLLTVFLGVVAARPNFRPGSVALAAVVAFVTLAVAVFWSSMKSEYRDWVSGGAGQVVVKSFSERLDYIANEVQSFDSNQFAKGLYALVDRLSYIDYIAATLVRVPEIIPHQDGRQLGEAVYHVLTPRALFPDKPPVPDDSSVTEYFTGIPVVAAGGESTSISIGYVGELYIDFGVIGSVVVAGLLGFGVGWASRKVALNPGNRPIVTYATLIIIALPLNIFETALIKLVGASVTAILAAWVLSWWGRSPQAQVLFGQQKRSRRSPTTRV